MAQKKNKSVYTLKNSKNKDLITGYIFAFIVLVGDGFQTIVSNTRPTEIDPLMFSWITACVELIIGEIICLTLLIRVKSEPASK